MEAGEVRENIAWAKRVKAAGINETGTLAQLLASALLETAQELLASKGAR